MRKILITSALPYVNNNFHIGHLVGCLLPSDVYARFCRAKYGKENVLFICGADEHGTPATVGARKEKITEAEYVDKYRSYHEKSVKDFNLSFDGGYGRTHTKLQEKLVQDIYLKLEKNGYIEEKTTLQPYSIDDKMFLADRQIEGKCPFCGYEKARGDQCDKCGELLDPSDLINPYVPETGSKNIELRETKNLFYLASKTKNMVKEWFEETSKKNRWSNTAISSTYKYLKEEIPNPSITRDLSWGIPVNKKGYENKVFYVWFDAPWGYVSMSQKVRDNWKDWWKNENCFYVQFMGKDNIKFHSIFFPGQIIAVNDNWKKVDLLKGLNFLNFEGEKISKSTGNGIFLNTALEDADSDVWRYALMSSCPETDDNDFTIQRFADIVNKDLNGILGNFVSRVCKITEKIFGNKIPKGSNSDIFNIDENINNKLKNLTDSLDKCEFRKAISVIREIWTIGNEFMTEQEPWKLIKEGKVDKAGYILNECFNLINFFSEISYPFIPETSKKIKNIFNLNITDEYHWPEKFERNLKNGDLFNTPENLFSKIDDKKILEMSEKYTKKKSKFKIAKIISITKHPDSDHLSILEVDNGDKNYLKIVCGAPNVYVGMVSVLAEIGAKIPENGNIITKRKVAGIVSNGMMCSEKELGISENNDGIIELSKDYKVGDFFKING